MQTTDSASFVSQKELHRAPLVADQRHVNASDGATIDELGAVSSAAHPLIAKIDELAGAARRKDEFLAILSHELRSPLASILYAIGVLRSRGGGDLTVQHGMHELIERQVRQMTFLASGLLDVSRITRGELQLQRERVDLRAVLSNAVETLEPALNQRQHHLSVTWPESSIWVLADAARLEQVFVNLLANASKYTDTGGALAVSTHASDGYAIVRISDSGIGIAANVLPYVFDLFMQADAAGLRSRTGLGIGLALVRTIVDLHGGSVTAASAGLGLGSEFTVRLPEHG